MNDLANGQKYENWFAKNFLTDLYTTNDDKLYDIKNKGKKYEIKCDSQCFVYYRFGFEISSWNGLSGIHTTDADYWVTIIPVMNVVLILPVDTLKLFMKEHKNHATFRKTGDAQASKMILWDYNYFMDNIKEYDGYRKVKTTIPNFYGQKVLNTLITKMITYTERPECDSRREITKINDYYTKLIEKINKIK